jgi:aerobic carbon-monoxide dehydrogenase medium subunit
MMEPQFEFLKPETVAEACAILKKSGGMVNIMAGGTELLANIKEKQIQPASLVSLASIEELHYINFDEKNGLDIGAMATIAELAASDIIRQKFPALTTAAGQLGSLEIRDKATIGGNIFSSWPAPDLIGPLMAYGAMVKFSNGKQERSEMLENIFLGPEEMLILYDEILTGVHLDTPEAHTGDSYIKYCLEKEDEPIVSLTSVLTIKKSVCTSIRIALGAVVPNFVLCPIAEDLLIGQVITEELARQTGQFIAGFCNPVSDSRASADYRRQLVQELIEKSIMEAVSKAAVK